MANYMVRVELHGASYNDYETLHAAMAMRGFSRTILGGDGANYQLPTAEYKIVTSQSGEQVRQQADTAASTTGRQHGVLVVDYGSAWWIGLPRAQAA